MKKRTSAKRRDNNSGIAPLYSQSFSDYSFLCIEYPNGEMETYLWVYLLGN